MCHREKRAGMDGSKRGNTEEGEGTHAMRSWVHSFLHTKGLLTHSQVQSVFQACCVSLWTAHYCIIRAALFADPRNGC